MAGDGGLIEWESDNTAPIMTALKAEKNAVADVALPLSPLAEDPYTAAIKHFYHALMTNSAFDVTATDALVALQIAEAAIQSAHTGRPVTLSALPEVAS